MGDDELVADEIGEKIGRGVKAVAAAVVLAVASAMADVVGGEPVLQLVLDKGDGLFVGCHVPLSDQHVGEAGIRSQRRHNKVIRVEQVGEAVVIDAGFGIGQVPMGVSFMRRAAG